MISQVLMQTLVTRDLDSAMAAFMEALGWELRERAPLAAALAQLWGVPLESHRRFAIVAPPGAARGYLRLVEGPEDDGTGTFHKRGLFNAELLSKDVEALHAKLQDRADFRTVSSLNTYDLSSTGGATSRSFATRGPGGAGVFFTQYLKVPPPRTLPVCEHLAGPMFNAALATDVAEPVTAFYEGVLGMTRRLAGRLQQPSVNRIIGLPEDWGFLMWVYKGEGDGLIEVDVHDQPVPREPALGSGGLRPGNSFLTLETRDMDAIVARAQERGFSSSGPREVDAAPYAGRRAAGLTGPAGERVELVETPR